VIGLGRERSITILRPSMPGTILPNAPAGGPPNTRFRWRVQGYRRCLALPCPSDPSRWSMLPAHPRASTLFSPAPSVPPLEQIQSMEAVPTCPMHSTPPLLAAKGSDQSDPFPDRPISPLSGGVGVSFPPWVDPWSQPLDEPTHVDGDPIRSIEAIGTTTRRTCGRSWG